MRLNCFLPERLDGRSTRELSPPPPGSAWRVILATIFFNKTISGANLLTITAGHTLDMIEAVLGPIIEVDAVTETLWPAIKATDTGGHSVRETPDHIGVLSKTRSAAVSTTDISGGVAPENARSYWSVESPS